MRLFLVLLLCSYSPLISHVQCSHYHHPEIGDYEGLNYAAISPRKLQTRVRRAIDSTASVKGLQLHFSAFQRTFLLVVYPDASIVSPDLVVTVGGARVDPDRLADSVRGFLVGQPDSLVLGTVVEGLFRGVIAPKKELLASDAVLNITNDIFFVESPGNYFDNDIGFHSIMYRASGVRKRSHSSAGAEPTFCGHSNPDISKRLKQLSSPVEVKRVPRSIKASMKSPRLPDHALLPSPFHGLAANLNQIPSSKNLDGGPQSRVCNLYLQSDTFLWDHVITMPHIRGNRDLAIKEITSIFTQHVQGAQAIYQYSTFKDPTGRHVYRGVSFRVDRVLINVTDEDCHQIPVGYSRADHEPPTPSALPRTIHRIPFDPQALPQLPRGSYAHENPFCAENVDVTNFLNLNSYVNHNDFCLAYVFTFRDFSGGTLGLAWVAEPGGSGGVCEKHRLMREGSQTVKKSLNTGVVTLLNYGSRVSMKISQLTFAHEMGHNLGAKHDDDFKEEVPECLPSVDDPAGNYIMFASATGGDKENNNQFSNCSSHSIARLLTQVLKSDSNCFLTSNGSFCGNRLTEEGEQCDCGFTKEDCDDICCHPKESPAPCNLTRSVVVNSTNMNVHCSPTAGECCTSACQHRTVKHLCRGAGECHKSSFCSGTSAQCPASEHLPDGTACKNNTRICKSGECQGSICEGIPGWQECSLTRGPQVTPEMMCYVACRQNHIPGAPCISTIQLELDADLRKSYPRLASELLHVGSGRGVRLQPGTPCDNYRGYCDVFHNCQSVEFEGPLARLRSLLFSPQVLSKVKTWITVNWWAMLLISFVSILAMIIFMKLCGYRTPSSHPRPAGPPGAVHLRLVDVDEAGPPSAVQGPSRPNPAGLVRERSRSEKQNKINTSVVGSSSSNNNKHFRHQEPPMNIAIPYQKRRGRQSHGTTSRPMSVAIVAPTVASAADVCLPALAYDHLPNIKSSGTVNPQPPQRRTRGALQWGIGQRPVSVIVAEPLTHSPLVHQPPTRGTPPPLYSSNKSSGH